MIVINNTKDLLIIVEESVYLFYKPMFPWILLAMALVVTDLRFGIKAAQKRGEIIRTSRAWRRSLNKLFDYLCWITVAALCGQSIGKVLGLPVTSIAILLLVYGIEISSSMNNFFEYKGIQKKFNFWKLIKRSDISTALEDKSDVTSEKKDDTSTITNS